MKEADDIMKHQVLKRLEQKKRILLHQFNCKVGKIKFDLSFVVCFRFPAVLFGRPGIPICHETRCIC